MSNVPQENTGISGHRGEQNSNLNPHLEQKTAIDLLHLDSWVDLSGPMGTTTPPLIGTVTPPFTTIYHPSAGSSRRVTPVPFGGEHDYLRMLREAQRESNRSSTKVSPISSALISLSTTPKRNSPCSSPKSPPNSPNCELATFAEELRGVYVNRIKTDPVGIHGYSASATNGPSSTPPFSNSSSNGVTASDIVWDWTSRPNIPKEWKLPSNTCRSRKSSESSRLSKINGKITKKSIFSKEVIYTLVITNLISFLIGTGIGIWLSKKSVDQCDEIINIAI